MICSYKIPLPERAFFHIHSVGFRIVRALLMGSMPTLLIFKTSRTEKLGWGAESRCAGQPQPMIAWFPRSLAAEIIEFHDIIWPNRGSPSVELSVDRPIA